MALSKIYILFCLVFPIQLLHTITADINDDIIDSKQDELIINAAGDSDIIIPPNDNAAITWSDSTEQFMRLRFVSAFITSFSMILVSEIGDKTFFIAAIMAMKHNRNTVFAAAMVALGIMTVLSAGLGYALPSLLPRDITHYCAIGFFVYFGFKLLYEAYHMKNDETNDELKEVETELNELEDDDSNDKNNDKNIVDLESGTNKQQQSSKSSTEQRSNGNSSSSGKHKDHAIIQYLNKYFSRIFLSVFTMTFLAEWGDRSQIATIALAAAKDPIGVSIGAIIGHSICTGVAVIGGKLLASRISEKTVATVGGVLFLIFAIHSYIYGD